MAIRIASKPPEKAKPARKPGIEPQRRDGPGRPSSGKIRVTMLLRPGTVERFKSTGKGWQARMSDILDKNAP